MFKKKKINDEVGSNKHYPASNQEWCSSIYVYNKNYNKFISALDDYINNLVLTFFNTYFAHTKDINSARGRIAFKRKLINKIFISDINTKHTNEKVIINIFTYNREKFFLIKKIFHRFIKIRKKFAIYYKNKTSKIKPNKKKLKKRLWTKYNASNNIKKLYNLIIDNNMIKIKLIKLVLKVYINNNYIKRKKNNEIKLLLKIFNNKNTIDNCKGLFYDLNKKYMNYNVMRFNLQKLYIYQNKILLLNSYKYKDFFLSHLKSLTRKFYNKDVEFNIINLKQLSLNSDIFIQALVTKLNDRKNRFLRVLNKGLSIVKPVFFNKLLMLEPNIIKKKVSLYNKYNVNNFLSKTYNYHDENLYQMEKTNILRKNILDQLYNKNVKGIKMQAAGRLTKRLIASRSVYKFKYKGSIHNIDSSHKCLSSPLLKGYTKSNIQYTLINSETRNGSFGLKGWISSY